VWSKCPSSAPSWQGQGKLVVELDLRGNMNASTIHEILEINQVPGVSRVALGE